MGVLIIAAAYGGVRRIRHLVAATAKRGIHFLLVLDCTDIMRLNGVGSRELAGRL